MTGTKVRTDGTANKQGGREAEGGRLCQLDYLKEASSPRLINFQPCLKPELPGTRSSCSLTENFCDYSIPHFTHAQQRGGSRTNAARPAATMAIRTHPAENPELHDIG